MMSEESLILLKAGILVSSIHIERNSHNDDNALDEVMVDGINAEKLESVCQNADEQCAQHGSLNRTCAASERYAADNNSREHVVLIALCLRGRCLLVHAGEDETAECAHDSADDVGDDDDLLDIDAAQLCAFLVSSDTVDVASVYCFVKNNIREKEAKCKYI